MPDFVMKRDYEVSLIVHPFVAAMPATAEATQSIGTNIPRVASLGAAFPDFVMFA